uniref:XRE family transcriptional regulator n=1 Tax=Edaphosphingomonas laterariae TaxID=861865 RepID=UPI0015C58723|nr:XRE family transcriptional regulator [Sphingomonas laterariae]
MFADLGLSHPEDRLAQSRLAAALQRRLEELGLTYAAAASAMDMPPSKLLEILRGRCEGLSEGYVAERLAKLERTVKNAH